jgi:hypothetical protein
VTDDQRELLISTYLRDGYDAAAPLAVEYGVSPRHVAKLLRRRGIKNTTKRGRKPGSEAGKNNPRWRWAIERGAVVV